MKKSIKIILIVLLLIIILFLLLSLIGKIKIKDAKSDETAKDYSAATKIQPVHEANDKEIGLYFCPRDNCSFYLEQEIISAKNTVHCAFYDLRLQNIIDALAKRSKDIDVKAAIDNDNNKGQLNFTFIRFDNSNQLSHNKFCIIDNEKVWTGSFNPTSRDNDKNNNNAMLIYSQYLSKNYEAEFQELWKGDFGKGSKAEFPIIYLNRIMIENYFCPDDGCSKHTQQLIKSANESVRFMTFSFTDSSIGDWILYKDKNITIQGVFEKMQAASDYSQYQRLKDFNLDVKIDNNPTNMHHKVFIIDSSIVQTGSYNPTGAGTGKNDENMLIIHDKSIAERFMEEFEYVHSYEKE